MTLSVHAAQQALCLQTALAVCNEDACFQSEARPAGLIWERVCLRRYVPGPVLREGRNEIIMLEVEHAPDDATSTAHTLPPQHLVLFAMRPHVAQQAYEGDGDHVAGVFDIAVVMVVL